MIKLIKQRLKNQKGLTLVELLAVVVILAIIAAIAIPAIGSIISNQKEKAHEANITMIENAARLYLAGESPALPLSTQNIDGVLVDKGYLEDLPNDPRTDEAYRTATFSIDASGNITVTLE